MQRPDSDRIVLDFVALGITEVVLLGRYCCHRPQPPLKAHRHPGIFEVVVVDHGTQPFFIGPKRYDLQRGDILITHPDDIHGTGPESQARACFYWLEFRQNGKNRSFLGMAPRDSRLLINRFLNLSQRQFSNGGLLIPTFERILAANADKQNPLRTAEIQNLLLRLVLDTIAIAERRFGHRCSEGIQRVISYIEDHLNEPVSLPQLAEVSRMSESYFKIVFSRETGMPPGHYVLQRRIERAKDLLQTSTQSITKIAIEGGFASSQHFATVFKRITGLTPRSFRKHAREGLPEESIAVGYGPAFHPIACF